jgi:hypothetical protein
MKWGWYNGGFAKKNIFPIAPFVHRPSKCEKTSQITSIVKGDIVFEFFWIFFCKKILLSCECHNDIKLYLYMWKCIDFRFVMTLTLTFDDS